MLASPIYCWCLLRERSICFVLFLRHLECRAGEVPGQVSMQRKSWVSELPPGALPLVKKARASSICLTKSSSPRVQVDCDRPSHKWHSLCGILSAAGLQFWNFFSLDHLRELHHRKCKFSGNFTVLDFATSTEQAAAKQIIPFSHICDFVLLA